MVYVYASNPPNVNETEAFNIVRNSFINSRNTLLLYNYKIEGRTTESDLIVISPGMIVCLEFKNWHGTIQIPSDMSEWYVSPPVKNNNPAVSNPLNQCKRSESSLKEYLRNGSGYDNSKWFTSSAVVLTNLNRTVSFIGNNESITKRTFFIENFYDNFGKHVNLFHGGLTNRQESITVSEIRLILARLQVPHDLVEEYILDLKKPSSNRSSSRNTSPASSLQQNYRLHGSAIVTDSQKLQRSSNGYRDKLTRYTEYYIKKITEELKISDTISKTERSDIYNEFRIAFLVNIRTENPRANYDEILEELSNFQNSIENIERRIKTSNSVS